MAWTSDGVTDNKYIKWRLSWSESDKNEANNTSKVTVKLYVRRTNTGYSTSGSGTAYIWIDGTKYSGSITNSTTITSTEKCILTKSKTITHNSDGSKSISIAGDISHSRFDATKKSWSITLSTIPRASSISSISGNTIGSSITVNISRKSSAFKHTVEFYIRSTKISTWSSVATKQTFTPDLNTCCSKITSATSATAKINVTTYNGSTKIGSTASKSFTIYVPSSAVPSMSAFTLTPSNSNSLLASSGLYVQGYTKYTAAITAAGIYGSTIKSYATSGGGTSTASASATSGVISQSGTINITATATDTRGRTVTQTKSITVLSYAKPTITTNIYRCDANGYENSGGDNVYINILSKNATSLNGLNSVNSVKVQYKKTTETAWSSAVTISGTTTILKNLSSDSTYNLKFTITDKIGSTNYLDTTVNSEKVILDIFKGGQGVNFGGVATETGLATDWIFKPKGGTFIHYANANSGTSGYLKIATIKITTTYQNVPIQIVLTQRGRVGAATVHIIFNGANSTDPTLKSFFYETINDTYNIYIVKSATSTWDLYIQKSEAYDSVGILDYSTNLYYMTPKVEWKNEFAASVPSGYTAAYNYKDRGKIGRECKLLWTGNFSSGSITIKDLPYYNILLVKPYGYATTAILSRDAQPSALGGNFRGGVINPYISTKGARAIEMFAFSFSSSGTTLTFKVAHKFAIYDDGSNPANNADCSIDVIYGVI